MLLALLLAPALAFGQTAPVVTGPPGLYSFSCPSPVTIEHGDSFVIIRWGTAPPAPKPPGPTPPTPPTPAPIADKGLRVLIVYESADLSKMPPAQVAVLYDATLRAYLDSATVLGADGKTHEYRIWDQHVTATGDSQLWQSALARPRGSVPWIIVSNGTNGMECQLPPDTAQTIALVKQYEVKP